MLRALALFILKWMEGQLDPEAQARVEVLRNKAKALEAEEVRLLAEVEAGEKKIAALGVPLKEDLEKRKELEAAIERSKAEMEKKLAELDSLSEHDGVRLDV